MRKNQGHQKEQQMTDQELSDEQDAFELYRAAHIAEDLARGLYSAPHDPDAPLSQPPKGTTSKGETP
jgi:hypothetical protein